MFKTTSTLVVFAFAAFATASPALAQSERNGQFQHAGTTYSFVEKVNERGVRVISGRSGDGRSFRLFVEGRTVRGMFNGNPVTFGLNEVQPLKVAVR